ncbi:ABC transporter permease [Nocardioides sp. L-11A]|uniref:ABC transporter permease n=1 Tax=Nocardioides sp. L-11A TaxID=3043848 RepID=UPI00249B2F0A|nr:ABC transporter permease [Nocardioides sp. L-11A]
MIRAVLVRVVEAVVSLLIASGLVWALQLFAQGDPARRILKARGVADPSPAMLADFRAEHGMDDGMLHRYLDWTWGVLHGDLGTSWRTGRPVAGEFLDRLPATVVLAATALVIALVLSTVLAMVPVVWRRASLDHTARLAAAAFIVVPNFLLAVVFLEIVVRRLGFGRVVTDGSFATVGLPALALALGTAGYWSRILRTSLLEAASATYLDVSTARGSGPLRRTVLHVLPNALPTFLTVVGVGTASLLAGAPVIEAIFTWPGVGRYTIDAILARDVPVVQAFTLLSVAVYIVVSLLVDLAILAIDPRRGARRPRRRVRPPAAQRALIGAGS